MKKKIPVAVELGRRGQAVLSALRDNGIDPSDALAEEIERRSKKAKEAREKKISRGVGVK